MDTVEIIWLLALGAWAVVSRLLRSRQPPEEDPESLPREAPAYPSEPEPAGDTPVGAPRNMRELLREIRRGIQQAANPPEEVPEPVVEYRTDPEWPEPEPEANPFFEPPPSPPPVTVPGPRRRRRSVLARGLMDDLTAGPSSLGRAMLLREVLGPPVALRGEDGGSRRG